MITALPWDPWLFRLWVADCRHNCMLKSSTLGHFGTHLGTALMQGSDRIGRRLKLLDLHVFMAVADRLNMAKAAESLSISRPVVSKTIVELEATLGARLLDRHRKAVEITPCGRALLKWTLAAFDDLRQSVNEIEQLNDPTTGELRVGCSDAVLVGLLPAIVDLLHRRHPKLTFHVASAPSGERLFRMLRERSVDLAFGRANLPIPDGDLAVSALLDERPVVVGGARSRWVKRRRVQLKELIGEAWVLSDPNSAVATMHSKIFRQCGLEPPRAAVTTDSVHLAATLAATGRFLAIVPASALHLGAGRLGVKALAVVLPDGPRSLAIVTLKGRSISPIAEHFIHCAREVAGSYAITESAA